MRLVALLPERLDGIRSALREQLAGGRRASGPFRLVEEDGALTGPFNAMLHAPIVGAALGSLGEAIRYGSTLDAQTREVAILTVAVLRRSSFEWYAHKRVAEVIGMSPAAVGAIFALDADRLPPAEAIVLRLTRAIVERTAIDDTLFVTAEALLGTESLVELTMLVGYYELLASMMAVFDIGVPVGEVDPFE